MQGPQVCLQSVNACGPSYIHPGPSYVHTALYACTGGVAPFFGSLLLCPPLPLSLSPLKPMWASGRLGMHTPPVTNTDSLISRLDPNRWTAVHLHINTHICCFIAQSCLILRDSLDCSTPGFLSFIMSRSLLKLMSIESVMPSDHLIPCCPFLLLPSVCPSIRVSSSESALCITY